MKMTICFAFLSLLGPALQAQFTQQQQDSIRRRQVIDSIRKVTEEDHKGMMTLLGISSLRPGVNGSNPNAPNAANYDESKANPYPNLPDGLTLKNGKKVTRAIDWWQKRRPEVVEDFDTEVYGRTPKTPPKSHGKLSVQNSTPTITFPLSQRSWSVTLIILRTPRLKLILT